jgi:hypothetical protein
VNKFVSQKILQFAFSLRESAKCFAHLKASISAENLNLSSQFISLRPTRGLNLVSVVSDDHQDQAFISVRSRNAAMATRRKKARKPSRPPLSDGYGGDENSQRKILRRDAERRKIRERTHENPKPLGCQSEDRRRIQFNGTRKRPRGGCYRAEEGGEGRLGEDSNHFLSVLTCLDKLQPFNPINQNL